MSQQTKRINRRMASTNETKFANLDASLTTMNTFITSKFGILELFVNPNMSVGVSTDKTTVYRLSTDRLDVVSKLSNDYVCIELKIGGERVKCSRNILIGHLFGQQIKNDTMVTRKKPDSVNRNSKADMFVGRNFDPSKTYIEQSLAHNFVKNPDVNVYFDMDSYTFYTPKHIPISSPNGLKSGAYVVYPKNGQRINQTMTQINIVAMMYGIDIPKGAIVSLISENKPLTKDNIKFISKNEYMSQVQKGIPKKLGGSKINQIKSKNLVSEYITEDFSKFHDRQEALQHQIKVDKAKEVIQLFVDNKCGHSVAEKAFLKIMEVDRHNTKYKHFIDVLNNNKGILEVKKESMKVDLNVKIDTLIINASDKEVANTLINEINDRVSKLKNL